MSKSLSRELVLRRTFAVVLYTAFIIMFLAGPFRRIAPWIKAYHVSYGLWVIASLILVHLWSVKKLLAKVFVSKMSTPGTKIRYSIILGLILTLIAMIITGYFRKKHIIIRDFHTFYFLTVLTSLIIMHIFSELRRKTSTGEIYMRKDYQWFPAFATILIIITVITAITVIILQKSAVL